MGNAVFGRQRRHRIYSIQATSSPEYRPGDITSHPRALWTQSMTLPERRVRVTSSSLEGVAMSIDSVDNR